MSLLSTSTLAAIAITPAARAARGPAFLRGADALRGHLLAAGTTVRVRDAAGARLHVDDGLV